MKILISCLLTLTRTDCTSVALEVWREPSVDAVVLVKGISSWIRVSRPPPPDLVRSVLICDYPWSFRGFELGDSFVA